MATDMADSAIGRFSGMFFNQWIDNEFSEGDLNDRGPFGEGFVGVSVERGSSLDTVPAIGNRFVGNRLKSATRMGSLPWRPPAKELPGGRDAIFEGNFIANTRIGISLGEGTFESLIRRNLMENVAIPCKDMAAGSRVLNNR